jgi:hypothetical protein
VLASVSGRIADQRDISIDVDHSTAHAAIGTDPPGITLPSGDLADPDPPKRAGNHEGSRA